MDCFQRNLEPRERKNVQKAMSLDIQIPEKIVQKNDDS